MLRPSASKASASDAVWCGVNTDQPANTDDQASLLQNLRGTTLGSALVGSMARPGKHHRPLPVPVLRFSSSSVMLGGTL